MFHEVTVEATHCLLKGTMRMWKREMVLDQSRLSEVTEALKWRDRSGQLQLRMYGALGKLLESRLGHGPVEKVDSEFVLVFKPHEPRERQMRTVYDQYYASPIVGES